MITFLLVSSSFLSYDQEIVMLPHDDTRTFLKAKGLSSEVSLQFPSTHDFAVCAALFLCSSLPIDVSPITLAPIAGPNSAAMNSLEHCRGMGLR
jgi:hypothetical protein